jgi:hypothetical protein
VSAYKVVIQTKDTSDPRIRHIKVKVSWEIESPSCICPDVLRFQTQQSLIDYTKLKHLEKFKDWEWVSDETLKDCEETNREMQDQAYRNASKSKSGVQVPRSTAHVFALYRRNGIILLKELGCIIKGRILNDENQDRIKGQLITGKRLDKVRKNFKIGPNYLDSDMDHDESFSGL